MKRILWVSRHEPLESQIRELQKIYNDEVRIEKMDSFKDVSHIVREFQRGGYDDILIVAPLSVIQEVARRGVKPLWAEMEQVSPEEAETEASGRYYRFKEFRRIEEVKIIFTEP